jgi:hypothetical protein
VIHELRPSLRLMPPDVQVWLPQRSPIHPYRYAPSERSVDGAHPQDEDRGAQEHVPWARQAVHAGPPRDEPASLTKDPDDHPQSKGGDDWSMTAKVQVMFP